MRLFSNQVRQSIDLTRPGTAAEVLRQSAMPPQGLVVHVHTHLVIVLFMLTASREKIRCKSRLRPINLTIWETNTNMYGVSN